MSKSAFQKLVYEIALLLFVAMFTLSGSVTAQHKAYSRSASQNTFTQVCINGENSAASPKKDGDEQSDHAASCTVCVTQNSFINAASNYFSNFQTYFHQDIFSHIVQWEFKRAIGLPPSHGPPSIA